jgi:hypothetical protein
MLLRLLMVVGFLVCRSSAADPLDLAFGRLYNFDFAGAQQILDKRIAASPEEPLPHAVRASTFLFSELDRMQILESEFFASDKRITEKKGARPDPQIRSRLFESIEKAQGLANAKLSGSPDDASSLFSLCLTSGLTADYAALIEKRPLKGLSFIKQSQQFAVELLKRHPAYTDAYLSGGVAEYLLASVPFFVRWFIRLDDTQGSKEQAAAKLKRVAESGRYLKPFAKLLLSIYYLREKRPEQTQLLLAELAHDYPENPLIRKELAKVSDQLKTAR